MIDELNRLLGDKKSGSEKLLSKLISLLLKHRNDPSKIYRILGAVKSEMNSFAVIMNFIKRTEKNLENYSANNFKEFIEKERRSAETKLKSLCKNTSRVLKNCKKVLTISNSNTVYETLNRLSGSVKSLEIIICEARPNLEGRKLAKKFVKSGVNVQFITEAQSGGLIEKCDAVVIGADKIFSDGSILNKTGSRSLAIICNYFNVPFYVISLKDKRTDEKEPVIKEYDQSEIWNYKHNNLTVKNNYFEVIESSLITEVITD